ncbi:MAG: magnesium/cobalt transporter CorA [Chloroflexi bacterium]|nr:magnesium/cobalt transporter CorA [Chloroflexota bacterium]
MTLEGVRSAAQCAGEAPRLDLSVEEMRAALADPASLLWVDIAADGHPDGRRILAEVFGFHALTIDDCYNTLIDPPKVDDYGEYLFVIAHNVRYDAPRERLVTNELDLYIGANYVVTVHRSDVRAVEEVRRRAESRALVLDRGPAFLAHALLDVVVDDFHPVVELIDDEVVSIEELILANPAREILEEVLRLKRNAQRLKRSVLPQRDLLNRFSRGEYPKLITAEALMYFRDVYDHTVRVDEMIDGVRDLADGALNTYLSSVNNRINEVMKTLAIVTVIFLPLTLIAGIYGTNFRNVPEYGVHYGYYGMLAGMVLLSASLIGWFKLRGWF